MECPNCGQSLALNAASNAENTLTIKVSWEDSFHSAEWAFVQLGAAAKALKNIANSDPHVQGSWGTALSDVKIDGDELIAKIMLVPLRNAEGV